MPSSSLTHRQILSKATSCLEEGGYHRVEEDVVGEWPLSNSRLFEDPHSVVAIVVYETWDDLNGRWKEAQAWLVDVINQHLRREQSKAWDGYLVLLTSASPGLDAREVIDEIRYDLSRVRKFVRTGERLKSLDDVEAALLPLLPFSGSNINVQDSSALEMLPRLLADKYDQVERDAVESLIVAFETREALMKTLHKSIHEL